MNGAVEQCCVNAIHIENTEIENFEYRDFSVVELFWVYVCKYEDLGIILGILGFYAYQTGDRPEVQFVPKKPYIENIPFRIEKPESD